MDPHHAQISFQVYNTWIQYSYLFNAYLHFDSKNQKGEAETSSVSFQNNHNQREGRILSTMLDPCFLF